MGVLCWRLFQSVLGKGRKEKLRKKVKMRKGFLQEEESERERKTIEKLLKCKI